MRSIPTALNAFLVLATALTASVSARTVLSTVIFTHHGEREPDQLPGLPVLTTTGATQLYQAGLKVRQRYLAGANNGSNADNTLWGISPNILKNEQITIRTPVDQWSVASAQAFSQGLYPSFPFPDNSSMVPASARLSSGSPQSAPLNNYQYPQIITTPRNHTSGIWVAGTVGCSAYTTDTAEVANSVGYVNLLQESNAFYEKLYSEVLIGSFDHAEANFHSADAIYQYLQYEVLHNNVVAGKLTDVDLNTARAYAANLIALRHLTTRSASNDAMKLRYLIAGRTLANRVVAWLDASMEYQGTRNNMNLVFGDWIPMISFASLAGLLKQESSPFYDIPAPGSSFVFELYSMTNATQYPAPNETYVDFLHINGTGQYAKIQRYPLFGYGNEVPLSWEEFLLRMQKIAMPDIASWCDACQSDYDVCVAMNARQVSVVTSQPAFLWPSEAGMIGAFTTLAVVLVGVALAMFVGGFRVHRIQRKKHSDLGGFKGAEKLASDLDLSVPKGGAGAVVTEAGVAESRGQERVGSWELREQSILKDVEAQIHDSGAKHTATRRSSFDDDEIHVNPFATPVKVRDSL